jgi:cytochrome P450
MALARSRNARLDFDPYDAELREDPYPSYKRLRDEAPVFWSERFNMRVLTRYADVQAAGRDWKTYSSSQGLDLDKSSNEFLQMDFVGQDPPRHETMRSLVRPPFMPKSVGPLEPIIRTFAQELLDQLQPGVPFDFVARFAHPLPLFVVAHILGIPKDDLGDLSPLLLGFLWRSADQELIPTESIRAAGKIREYFAAIASRRRKAAGDDLLSTISRAEIDGRPFTNEELGGLCLFLFVAGVDTTATLITNTLFLLEQHPAQRQLVADDHALIPAAIEESLRYEAPLQHFLRVSTRDAEWHGEHVAAGTRFMLVYGSANRDERQFENPDAFDVRRPRKRHFSFGEGIHFCLGADLARLEARVALELILGETPNYRVVGPNERIIKENQRGFRVLTVQR